MCVHGASSVSAAAKWSHGWCRVCRRAYSHSLAGNQQCSARCCVTRSAAPTRNQCDSLLAAFDLLKHCCVAHLAGSVAFVRALYPGRLLLMKEQSRYNYLLVIVSLSSLYVSKCLVLLSVSLRVTQTQCLSHRPSVRFVVISYGTHEQQ